MQRQRVLVSDQVHHSPPISFRKGPPGKMGEPGLPGEPGEKVGL